MTRLPELPPHVLDRLAGCERVKLQVGRLASNAPLVAVAAPLRGQLFVLYRRTPAAQAEADATTAATLLAEGVEGKWTLSCRGRLLPGRSAQADTRRNELAHWVPDGTPGDWTAGRFFPEHLDFAEDTSTGRQRSSGPIPGVTPFVRWRHLRDLAFDPFQIWFLVSGILIAVGILAMDAQDAGTPWVLVTALLAGELPVVAARVLLAPLDLDRWRAGIEPDTSLGALAEARLSPSEYRAAGLRIALFGGAAWLVLFLLAGSAVTALVSLLSGAPVLLLAQALRRRSTAKAEGGE